MILIARKAYTPLQVHTYSRNMADFLKSLTSQSKQKSGFLALGRLPKIRGIRMESL